MEQIQIIESFSPEDTLELGRKMGKEAKPGEVYTLIGDLGVGKTVFTQGIADGLEIEESICSPTFTIVQVYEEGRMPFYNFDGGKIIEILLKSKLNEKISETIVSCISFAILVPFTLFSVNIFLQNYKDFYFLVVSVLMLLTIILKK